jgi:hypothetical protein
MDAWYETVKGTAIIWTKENKDKFRMTSHWKRFANHKKHVCEFCTCKSKNTQLHHLDPKNYDNLDRKEFKELCYSCHTKVQQLSRRKDRSSVPEYFLPFLEKEDK